MTPMNADDVKGPRIIPLLAAGSSAVRVTSGEENEGETLEYCLFRL
jgi:hypothetical protein